MSAIEHSLEYEQQFARNPQNYAALYNAGVAAFKENKLERAKECFDALKPLTDQQLDARRAEQLFYNAGNTEIKLKNYEDAVQSFEKVLSYNPNNEKAREKLAYAKRMLEEQEKKEQEQQQNEDDDQQKDQQDQSQNKNKDNEQQKNEQPQQGDDQEQQQQNNKDQQQQSKEQQRKEQQRKEQEQQKQEQEQKNAAQQEQERQEQKQQQKPEPDLTKEEQQLLAAVENLDKQMQGAFEARKLKKAQGATHGYHNW